MAGRNIHTIKHGEGWANREEESDRTIGKTFQTQAEAQEAGREEARSRKVEHLIHGEDGRIRERNSYGGDPFPPQG